MNDQKILGNFLELEICLQETFHTPITLTFLYTCVLVFYMGSLSQENKYTTRGSVRRFLFLSF